MLTKEAFNALLKTLEEPPEHVILILATTEFKKKSGYHCFPDPAISFQKNPFVKSLIN